MFLALLLCVMVQAQDNVEITLNNGNVVKGVTKTLFMLDDGDVVVAKDSKYREKKEYKSTEIKKPYTPIDKRLYHKKNSFGSGSIFHEANTPVKTMIDESNNMATEIPSIPTE